MAIDFAEVVPKVTVFKSSDGVSRQRDTYTIGHYNPSVRTIDLVFHTTYVVCVNFIHKWTLFIFNFIYFVEFLPESC